MRVHERDALQEKCEEISIQLRRAEVLTTSLGDEQVTTELVIHVELLIHRYFSHTHTHTCTHTHTHTRMHAHTHTHTLTQIRWQETLHTLCSQLTTLTGDSLLTAACLVYWGPFTPSYRQPLLAKWKHFCQENKLSVDASFSMQESLMESEEVCACII